MYDKMVTILDVAKLAGVAPGTVSRAIHNTGYIKAETRQKIERALQELNYIPNRAGRTLKTTRTNLIMLAIPDTANAIYVGMIEAVQECANQNGYSMVLYYTGGKKENELKSVRMLREHLVDGLFLIHFSYDEHLKSEIMSCNAPIVLCGMCSHLWAGEKNRHFHTVSIDVYTAIYTIVSKMIELGHRHIAYLAGQADIPVYTQRYEGFCAALMEKGLDVDNNSVFWMDYSRKNGYRAADVIVQMEHRPTALVASNDLQALGFWERCRDKGIRIPEDIALSGLDNLDESRLLHLTSICMKEGEVGKEGAELLMRELTGIKRIPPQDLRFSPEPIFRESTCRRS